MLIGLIEEAIYIALTFVKKQNNKSLFHNVVFFLLINNGEEEKELIVVIHMDYNLYYKYRDNKFNRNYLRLMH